MSYLCEHCQKPVCDYTPQICCDGFQCGCMGRPTEPCVCSTECWNALLNHRQMTAEKVTQQMTNGAALHAPKLGRIIDSIFAPFAEAIRDGYRITHPCPVNMHHNPLTEEQMTITQMSRLTTQQANDMLFYLMACLIGLELTDANVAAGMVRAREYALRPSR